MSSFAAVVGALGLLLGSAPASGVAPSPATTAPATGAVTEPAPEPSDDPLARAKALYQDGEARFDTADYLGAIDHWTEAFKLVRDTPDAARINALLIYNIATARERAYEVTGDVTQLRQAKVLLEGYAANIPVLFGDTPEAAEERTKVTERLNAITRAVDEAERKRKRERGGPTDDERPDDDDGGARGGRTALIASGATALALGVGGLAMMGAGLAMGKKANDIGGLEDNDIEGRREQFDRGRTGNTLAIAGGVIGGVFTITGAVLVGIGASRRPSGNVSWAPAVGRGLVGVGVSGRF